MRLNNKIAAQEPSEIVAEQADKKEQFIGSFRMQRGQKIFFVDTKQKTVREVNESDYAESMVDFKTREVKKKLVVPHGVVVVVALNLRNVYKKLSKAYRK